MIPRSVDTAVAPHTGAIGSARPLSGGCIAHASRLDAERGVFFLKWAEGTAGAGFEGEAAGLRGLAGVAPADIHIPQPLAASASAPGAPGYLLTRWIEHGAPTPAHSARLGTALAEMHRGPQPWSDAAAAYGFPADTVCGSTRQPNGWMESWPAFFRERRLAPIAARLRAIQRWLSAWDAPFESLLAGLEDRLPSRPHPSLVHGDLWSGNAFPAAAGATALVDPAAYVGDREVDLAMTALFGGFDQSFYGAYRDAWPPDPGYPDRAAVYDLYHLMNHALIFGGGYVGAVTRALGRAGRSALPGAGGARL